MRQLAVRALAVGAASMLAATACSSPQAEPSPSTAASFTVATTVAEIAAQTVITGDIGSSTVISEWSPGAEPPAEQIAELTDRLAAAGVGALVPLGSMRPDLAVTVSLVEFIVRDEDHVQVTVTGPDNAPRLSVYVYRVDQFDVEECPFFDRERDDHGSIRVRGAIGCLTRQGGRTTRVEFEEDGWAVTLDPEGDEFVTWLDDWVLLPPSDAS